MKRVRRRSQPNSAAKPPGRIILPPSFEEILGAAKTENGKFVPCGLGTEQLKSLERIIPEISPSACRRLDRLVYFWKIAREDASNATSPQEALENTKKICEMLEVSAQALDELLANEVAECYTKNNYGELINTVSVLKKAAAVLAHRLSAVAPKSGKGGRRNEFADVFVMQVQNILASYGLSLLYFDRRYQRDMPRIEFLKFIMECAGFTRQSKDAEQENRKYIKLINDLGLNS